MSMSITKSFWAAVLLSVVLSVPATAADTYVVDPSHAYVGFAVRHLVISTVNGRFNEFEGVIQFDPADASKSSVQGTIKTASIVTDDEKRDEHLKSSDFLDAAQHPEIRFESTKVEKKGTEYLVHGNLTIRGVTRAVVLPVRISGPIKDPWGNVRIGVEGNTRINRHDFGITWNKTLDSGGVAVGNEVELRIDVEATKH